MTFLIQSFQIFRKRFVTCLRVLVLFVLSLMYLAISSLRPEMFNLSKLIINFKNCIQIKSSKNCGAPSRSPSRVWNLKRVPRWQFSPQMNNFIHVVIWRSGGRKTRVRHYTYLIFCLNYYYCYYHQLHVSTVCHQAADKIGHHLNLLNWCYCWKKSQRIWENIDNFIN